MLQRIKKGVDCGLLFWLAIVVSSSIDSKCESLHSLAVEHAWIGEENTGAHIEPLVHLTNDLRLAIGAQSAVATAKRAIGAHRAAHRNAIAIGATLELG
jgi:hypothetical protein